MADMPHILVVDDDVRLRELLQQFLSEQGFFVSTARDAASAREMLSFFAVDGMVLDVMMPGESGMQLAQSLGRTAPPTLMLTAMGEAADRVAGLEAGVSDYLVKPFEPKELVLRLRNILARERSGVAADIHFGDFRFELSSQKLFRDHEPVYLTSSEALCLKVLADYAGQPVARERLAELTNNGAGKGNERSVDVQINRLRKKIEPVPGRPVYIQTVRGAGYVLHPARGDG